MRLLQLLTLEFLAWWVLPSGGGEGLEVLAKIFSTLTGESNLCFIWYLCTWCCRPFAFSIGACDIRPALTITIMRFDLVTDLVIVSDSMGTFFGSQ